MGMDGVFSNLASSGEPLPRPCFTKPL